MRWLWIAVAAATCFGCAKNNAPSQPIVETTPPDAVVDDPEGLVGMVEPRVTVLDNVALTLPVPPFSADTEVVVFPDSTRRVSEVRELVLRATFKGVVKPAQLTLELVQPSGDPYEARSAQLGGDPRSTYAADFIFPVAGTAIDRANLAGTWTARYFLGGEKIAEGTFELEP